MLEKLHKCAFTKQKCNKISNFANTMCIITLLIIPSLLISFTNLKCLFSQRCPGHCGDASWLVPGLGIRSFDF